MKRPSIFVRAFSVSIINQLKFHNGFGLCLASVHLPYLFHLVISFQLLGHAVALFQLRHDQLHAVSCRFFNLGTILFYEHRTISMGIFLFSGRPLDFL